MEEDEDETMVQEVRTPGRYQGKGASPVASESTKEELIRLRREVEWRDAELQRLQSPGNNSGNQQQWWSKAPGDVAKGQGPGKGSGEEGKAGAKGKVSGEGRGKGDQKGTGKGGRGAREEGQGTSGRGGEGLRD